MALCEDVGGHHVLTFWHHARGFDRSSDIEGTFLDWTAEANAWELITEVDFLLQERYGIVVDLQEQFCARLNILCQCTEGFDSQALATGMAQLSSQDRRRKEWER